MRIIRLLSRIFVGIVFIFSGFVKAVDPLGSTYKFKEYFDWMHLGFMGPFAFYLAILLSTVELVTGLSLLLNVKIRFTSWIALLFMVGFTILTFISAITNAVSDCGCFGDAIVLTNWQTFFKNIIIIVPAIIIFAGRKKFKTILSGFGEWTLLILFFVMISGLSIYCFRHLPLINFRPYKIGVHIPDKMVYPPDAPKDEYKSTIIYQKNGEKKEFDINSLPDSTWQWVETKNVLVKKGYRPPIHDFTIQNSQGANITDSILNYDGYCFLLSAYDLKLSSTRHQKKINELAEYCYKNNYKFICLTSSIDSEVEKFKAITKAPYEFCVTDEITLKTMIRANPGLILLKKGTILGKWNHRDIPSIKEFEEDFFKK